MSEPNKQEVTVLLSRLSQGDKSVLDQLLPVVYKELKKLSSIYLHKEYQNHTLQTTELVHEAYIKLVSQENVSWENRAHFFGIAANSMRQILVDYARKKKADKRGGGAYRMSLDEVSLFYNSMDDQMIQLDEALNKLDAFDNRMSRIVELRYFTGLTIEETAKVLDLSPATVKREWNLAKAWLYREIEAAN